jgi:AraC-like DNA-binding protein
MNPGQFVDRMRVEAARQMIDSSNLGLKAIADASGFHTADAMRRTFLRVLGITAGQYLHRFKRAHAGTTNQSAAGKKSFVVVTATRKWISRAIIQSVLEEILVSLSAG